MFYGWLGLVWCVFFLFLVSGGFWVFFKIVKKNLIIIFLVKNMNNL